ncbi:MAG: hypothetical protein RIR26_1938 [Pseudomonadota bacterium]|jgi:hypothetical protein
MSRLLFSVSAFFLGLFFHPLVAFADCGGIGFLVLRSSTVQEKVYEPFVENECVKQGKTLFGRVDYNPLTANQMRDLANLQNVVQTLSAQSERGVVILAYSEAGKFAAKLASLDSNVRALFLMDPVDGTPPFSSPQRFPIFLDENFPTLSIPVTVLESELGPRFERFGSSCVPPEMGPPRFYRHITPESLHRIFMEGLGHADFLLRPSFNVVDFMCGSGPASNEVVFARVLDEWNHFLTQIKSSL